MALFSGSVGYGPGPTAYSNGSGSSTETAGTTNTEQYNGVYTGISKELADLVAQIKNGSTVNTSGVGADAATKAANATNGNYLGTQQGYAADASNAAKNDEWFTKLMQQLNSQQGWSDATAQQYANPFTNQVVNTTLQGFDDNAARQDAAARAGQAGQNAFGTQSQLTDVLRGAESNKNRTSTEAQLRSEAYDKSFDAYSTDRAQKASELTAGLSADNANKNTKIAGAKTAADISQSGLTSYMDALAKQAGISASELNERLAARGFDLDRLNAISNALATGTKTTTELGTKNTSSSGSTTKGSEVADPSKAIEDIKDALNGGKLPDGVPTGSKKNDDGTYTGPDGTKYGADGKPITTPNPNPNPNPGTGTPDPNDTNGDGVPDNLPPGTVKNPDGTYKTPDGKIVDSNGNIIPGTPGGGTTPIPDPKPDLPDTNGDGIPDIFPPGTKKNDDGTFTKPDGSIVDSKGNEVKPSNPGTTNPTRPSGVPSNYVYDPDTKGWYDPSGYGPVYNEDGSTVPGTEAPATRPSYVPADAVWDPINKKWVNPKDGKPYTAPTVEMVNSDGKPLSQGTQDLLNRDYERLLNLSPSGITPNVPNPSRPWADSGTAKMSDGTLVNVNGGLMTVIGNNGQLVTYTVNNNANGYVTIMNGSSRTTMYIPALASQINAMATQAIKVKNEYNAQNHNLARGGFVDIGDASGRLDDAAIEAGEAEEGDDGEYLDDDLDDDTLKDHAELALSILSTVMDEDRAYDLLMERMDQGMTAIEALKAILLTKDFKDAEMPASKEKEVKALAAGGFVSSLIPFQMGAEAEARRTGQPVYNPLNDGISALLGGNGLSAFGDSLVPFRMGGKASDELEALKQARADQAAGPTSNAEAQAGAIPGFNPYDPSSYFDLDSLMADDYTPATSSQQDIPSVLAATNLSDIDGIDRLGRDNFIGAGTADLRGTQALLNGYDAVEASASPLDFKYDMDVWKKLAAAKGNVDTPQALEAEALIMNAFQDNPKMGPLGAGLLAIASADKSRALDRYNAEKWNKTNARDAYKLVSDMRVANDPVNRSIQASSGMYSPLVADIMQKSGLRFDKNGKVASGGSANAGAAGARPSEDGAKTVVAGREIDMPYEVYAAMEGKDQADILLKASKEPTFSRPVDENGNVVPDTSGPKSPKASFSQRARAFKAIDKLGPGDFSNMSGTLEGGAKENYDNIDQLTPGTNWLRNPMQRSSYGANSVIYQAANGVLSKDGMQNALRNAKLLAPVSNIEFRTLNSGGSGAIGGKQEAAIQNAILARNEAFEEYVTPKYEDYKKQMAAQGMRAEPLSDYSAKMYDRFMLTNDPTQAVTAQEANATMNSLPKEQRPAIQQAVARIKKSGGSPEDRLIVEKALGFGAPLALASEDIQFED